MRITILGAGSTGGFLAMCLAQAGHQVSLIARGGHLAALRARGLTLIAGAQTRSLRLAATDDSRDLGAQDVVFVCVKATALAGIVALLRPLVGPQTAVVFLQNGIPWWYAHGLEARAAPPDLPDAQIAPAILALAGPAQLVAGLVYSANEVIAPGVVRNNSPGKNHVCLGAVTRDGAARAAEVAALFPADGFEARLAQDIRAEIWAKLLANMSGSLIALATENMSSISRRDPALRAVYLRLVREGLAISAAHGYPLEDRIDPEAMIERISDHKPSLLQDFERHRTMEIAQIVEAPLMFARAAGVDAPALETLAAVVTRRARDRGLV